MEMRKTALSHILHGEAIFEENRTSLEMRFFFLPPPSNSRLPWRQESTWLTH